MALTKIELAESLVEKCGFDKRIAKLFVEQFFGGDSKFFGKRRRG